MARSYFAGTSGVRILCSLLLLCGLVACGGSGGGILQSNAGPTTVTTPSEPLKPGQPFNSNASSVPSAIPVIAGPAEPWALSSGWSMGELPATVPPEPLSLPDGAVSETASGRATSAVDTGFGSPGPHTLSASGPASGPDYFDYMASGPIDLAAGMDSGTNELHITGSVLASNIQDKIYAEIGLVTEEVYDLAFNAGVPSYMFNQSVVMLNALDGATPFCAPLDFNGTGGMGPAQAYPGTSYTFDLKLIVDPFVNYRGDCFLSINGGAYSPAGGFAYGTDNWGFRPPENFSQCRLVAQIYSYNSNPLITGSITFQDVRVVEGPQGSGSPHPWPFYGRDPQRSSVSPYAGPTSGTMKWPPFNAGAWLDCSPALADDGTLYISNTSTPTSLYAVDSISGSAKWLAPLVLPSGNCTLASPAISNGSGDGPGGSKRIYLGTAAGDFYTIRDNGNAGVVLNNVSGLGDMSQSTPLVSRSGLVYTATLGGFVLCFDSTGNLLWASPLPLGSCFSSPTLSADGSTVYVTSIAGHVYGFNAASGAFLYDSGATPAQLYCTPAATTGGVYVADYRAGSMVFFSFTPTLGLNWSSAFGGVDNAYSKIAPGPLGLYFASYNGGSLCAVDPVLHTMKWTFPVSSNFSSPTLSADNTVYFACWDGRTYFVRDNGATATQLFASPVIAASDSSPALGPDGTLYVCAGSSLYAYQDGGVPPPRIDCTALPNARFAVREVQGAQDVTDPFLTGYMTTNVVYDASALGLVDGDTFYVSFDTDAAAQPSDRALYPYVPIAGVVTFTATGLVLDAALATYFDIAGGGWTLQLKAGAYNRVTNDLDSLNWANYTLVTPGGTTITGPWPTNTSAADTVVLASGVQYRPLYSSLAYPLVGSTAPGRNEVIYPSQHAAGWIQVNGFPAPALSEGGVILGGFYDQSGLTNTLQADAYCRFEADIYLMVDDMRVRDVPNASWIVNAPPLRHLARPADVLVLARGTQFRLQAAGAPWQGATVTVTPGKTLNSLPVFTQTDMFAGTYTLRVLPVRCWDDLAATDPHLNVTPVGPISPFFDYDVTLNFLLQYGLTNAAGLDDLYVQIDGDYGTSWNDGTPWRIYEFPWPSSFFTTPGLKSVTAHIDNNPPGDYRFAIRVTDQRNGAQYTYVWPTLVHLLGWYHLAPGTADDGSVVSIAVVNGNPAIAYKGAAPNYSLMYVRANDALGMSWGAPVTLDTGSFAGNGDCSLAVIGGNPAIAYGHYATEQLRYIRATNANGTAWGAPVTVDAPLNQAQCPSLVTVNGRPAIAYNRYPANEIWYVRASDATGTAWGAPLELDSPALSLIHPSMAVVSGNPAVSYHDNYFDGSDGDLRYIRASNPDGTAWNAPQVVYAVGTTGTYPSLAVVAGNPAIAFGDSTLLRLRYIRANDATGATWGAPLIPDNANQFNGRCSLKVIAGNPAVAYNSWSDLMYVRATDTTGSTWGAWEYAGNYTSGDVDWWVDMAEVVGSAGIAYVDPNLGLQKYAHRH